MHTSVYRHMASFLVPTYRLSCATPWLLCGWPHFHTGFSAIQILLFFKFLKHTHCRPFAFFLVCCGFRWHSTKHIQALQLYCDMFWWVYPTPTAAKRRLCGSWKTSKGRRPCSRIATNMWVTCCWRNCTGQGLRICCVAWWLNH